MQSSNAIAAPPGAEPLWTVAEAAEYLNVSKSWVYRAAEAGTLPHLKLGGLVRFLPRAIREHASALEAQASGAAPVIQLAARRRRLDPKGGR